MFCSRSGAPAGSGPTSSPGHSWHFFVQGQYALSHPSHPVWGGLHVYAGLPILQIGPVALVVAWLFSPLGTAVSQLLAQVFGAAVGVVIVRTARRIAQEVRPELSARELASRTRWAVLFFTPIWLYLAVSSVHLDDVLAMLFGVLAVLAVVRWHLTPSPNPRAADCWLPGRPTADPRVLGKARASVRLVPAVRRRAATVSPPRLINVWRGGIDVHVE